MSERSERCRTSSDRQGAGRRWGAGAQPPEERHERAQRARPDGPDRQEPDVDGVAATGGTA
jgi:hypothetical protein